MLQQEFAWSRAARARARLLAVSTATVVGWSPPDWTSEDVKDGAVPKLPQVLREVVIEARAQAAKALNLPEQAAAKVRREVAKVAQDVIDSASAGIDSLKRTARGAWDATKQATADALAWARDAGRALLSALATGLSWVLLALGAWFLLRTERGARD